MRQGGRPRRSEEGPDSLFGKRLREHVRRVSNFTQAELSKETLVSEKNLSKMIKGKRTSGNTLRRDLRAIVKVLFRKNALGSLDEANALFTAIPTIKELDGRNQEDAEVIALFPESASLPTTTLAPSPESTSVSSTDLLPAVPSLPVRTKSSLPLKHVNWIISGVVCVALIGGLLVVLLVVTHAPTSSSSATEKTTTGCANATNGVILYTDVNYRGQCHVFPPGAYELAQFGLEENVSSLKDPNKAYHVTLYSKSKNTYYADADVPAFSPDWDNEADTMLVEKHRPTTCQPGANGIAAYIDTNYEGGCLFITRDIPDLTPLDFDQIITSLRFVGRYRNTRQLVLYTRPNYQDECGAYWQDQSDLLRCTRKALSVRVLPFTSLTPLPTVASTGTGNALPPVSRPQDSAQITVDDYLPAAMPGCYRSE